MVKGSGKAADLIADVHLVNKGLYKGDKDHHKLLKDALDHLDNEGPVPPELLTMGDEKKVKELRQKAKEYFEAHEDECAKIFKFYHMPDKNKDKVAPIVALVKAKPQGYTTHSSCPTTTGNLRWWCGAATTDSEVRDTPWQIRSVRP